MNLIESTIEYVKEIFKNDYSGHDFFHTQRVYRLSINLARQEGADELVVSLAALLHDVDDAKLSPQTSENKDRAYHYLKENQLDDVTITKIIQIIKEVSFVGTDSKIPTSIEGMCVQDADRLDAIGAIGIARCFSFGGNHHRVMYDPDEKPLLNMNEQQYRTHISTTVNHFYEKLFLLKDMMNTASAKQIAEERDAYMHQFIDEFMSEWKGDK